MIAVKHLTKFITDDSYDKFKYELKMCMIERITHKSHLVKLYNGTFYLWLFVKIIKFFTRRIRTLLIDKLIDKVKNELKDLNISEEELERKKKVDISSLIYMSDNVYRINHKIMNDINRYGYII